MKTLLLARNAPISYLQWGNKKREPIAGEYYNVKTPFKVRKWRQWYLPLSLDARNVNAANQSRVLDSGTWLSPIKAFQDSPEESARTHLTFSGTLEKLKFRAGPFLLVLEFCFCSPELSIGVVSASELSVVFLFLRRIPVSRK